MIQRLTSRKAGQIASEKADRPAPISVAVASTCVGIGCVAAPQKRSDTPYAIAVQATAETAAMMAKQARGESRHDAASSVALIGRGAGAGRVNTGFLITSGGAHSRA